MYIGLAKKVVSVVIACGCALLSVAQVNAAPRVARDTPPDEYLVLSGNDWLAGHGIGVYYYPGENPYHVTQDKTLWYECGELAIAFYMTLGYGQWKYADGSLIGSAAEMADIAATHPKGFEDLLYYKNGESTPPRPGDLVIWPAGYFGPSGHVAIVNRVLGSTVEVVQQNVKWDGEYLAKVNMLLALDSDGNYHLTASWDNSEPIGWIRTPRMSRYINQSSMRTLSGLPGTKWNRDGDTVYVYLSSDYTKVLADEELYDARSNMDTGSTPTGDLERALSAAGALDLTDSSYAQIVLLYAVGEIRSDSRLSPSSGVRSVDVTLKYTGDSIWLRPWGGPSSGKWIRFEGMWVVNMTA